jgi:NADH dehydrogenase [ubiquinone] 1 alpha subcomplex assembly factor 7
MPSANLVKHLIDTVRAGGPVNLSQFMQHALTHPTYGYYTSREHVLGTRGDFTTSPEISQIFGETVGIALVDWALKRGNISRPIRLLELGPGRGTLSHDIIRVARQFGHRVPLAHCSLVEISEPLRRHQQQLLGPLIDASWCQTIGQCPRNPGEDTFVVAHEFFDALPIHAFKRTEAGWREILVDHAAEDRNGLHLITSAQPTALQKILNVDQEYPPASYPLNATMELSPESTRVAMEISKIMLATDESLCFIADYGQFSTPSNSLRAIKTHQIIPDIFESLGECDLSADVDFGRLERCFLDPAFSDVKTVHQGHFLQRYGIRERTLSLIKQNRGKKHIVNDLKSAYERLVDPRQMGSIYKVLFFSSTKNKIKK